MSLDFDRLRSDLESAVDHARATLEPMDGWAKRRALTQTAIFGPSYRAVEDWFSPHAAAWQAEWPALGSRPLLLVPHLLAAWATRRAMKAGAGTTIRDLEAFLSASTIVYHDVLFVRGVWLNHIPNDGFEFVEGVRICQPNVLADSPQWPHLVAKWGHDPTGDDFYLGTVIIQEHVQEKGGPRPSTEKLVADPFECSEVALDVARLLALVGPSSPIPWVSWVELPPQIPGDVQRGGNEIILERAQAQIETDDVKALTPTFSAFTALSKKRRDAVRLALKHLAAAVAVRSPEEKALSLGIAAEAVLLHGYKERQQLSLTLRLAGAWLLGADYEKRKEIYGRLKRLYEMRSVAAHGERLSGERKDLLTELLTIERTVADVIQGFVNRSDGLEHTRLLLGGFPHLSGERS